MITVTCEKYITGLCDKMQCIHSTEHNPTRIIRHRKDNDICKKWCTIPGFCKTKAMFVRCIKLDGNAVR